MGTRTVYTPEMLKKIEEYATWGYSLAEIEAALGLKQGALSDRKYWAKGNGDLDILELFTRARENRIKYHVNNIENHASDDWRASKFRLANLDREHFSEHRQTEVTGKGGEPLEISFTVKGEKKKSG